MGTTARNKVKYDLKAAYYAAATESGSGEITYAAPVKFPGAVSISLSPEGDSEIFRADGGPYLITNSNNGYSGDLEMALVPPDFEKTCLGAAEAGGLIIENTFAEPTPFALLFEITGDKHGTRHAFFYCIAERHQIEAENPDKRSPKTEKISITAIARPSDGLVKCKTSASTPEEVYDAFFTAVPVPVSE